MERIEIPGGASYSPVALTDVIVGAPLASRLLLGGAGPGQIASNVALGLYLSSSAVDWVSRWGVRPIDFKDTYDADVDSLEAMPEEAREWEVRLLASAMNEDYTDAWIERDELATLVNKALTDYIASITNQEVVTSSQVRGFTIAKLVFPFAQGTCDMVSGDIAIFNDSGIFQPHIITHEFCHRKGYFKELHAQVLAFLALRNSGHPLLVQSARAERLHRHLAVLSDGDPERFQALLETACLRRELYESFARLRPDGRPPGLVSRGMRAMYDQRMKLFGQNGLSDYDEGFTNFLWTFGRSPRAKVPAEQAAV
ncbi:MAG: DUF3810 family protein [Myxococcota bacterium]